MAKGPIITDKTREVITKIYLDHPDWRAKEVQHAVNIELKGKGPGLSAVQKELTKIRKSPSRPFDKPFSLASLAEYDIPPEARPAVMSAYKRRLAEDDVLTIREALWIGRLYGVIEPKDLVCDYAFLYATEEMVSEIRGKPFDSRDLDIVMIQDVYHARETQREIAIWDIAKKYGADPVKLKDLNLSIEETEEIVKSNPEKFIERGEIP